MECDRAGLICCKDINTDEFCRIQPLSRPNPACTSILEKAFNEFRQCLDQTIHLQRDLIQLDRATDHMEQMLQEFEDSLLLLRNAMQVDQERLIQAITQCEDPTSELSGKIAQHLKVAIAQIQSEWSVKFCSSSSVAKLHNLMVWSKVSLAIA